MRVCVSEYEMIASIILLCRKLTLAAVLTRYMLIYIRGNECGYVSYYYMAISRRRVTRSRAIRYYLLKIETYVRNRFLLSTRGEVNQLYVNESGVEKSDISHVNVQVLYCRLYRWVCVSNLVNNDKWYGTLW